MLNLPKKLSLFSKKIALVVVYVEYDAKKNSPSQSTFEKLKSYLKAIKACKITYIRVDNKHEDRGLTKISNDTYSVGGDNSFREFSGWQKGLEAINKSNIACDLVLITNEMFLKPGPSFLQDYSSIDILERSLHEKKIIGRIDSVHQNYTLFGYDVSSWICTNCFFAPKKALDNIDSMVLIDENIDSILPQHYPPNHQINRQTINQSSTFTFNTHIPSLPSDLRIELNKSHAHPSAKSGKDKQLGFIIKSIKINNLPCSEDRFSRGITKIDGDIWLEKTSLFETIETDNPAGILSIEGIIPSEILSKNYDDQLEITIYNDSCLYKENAPINRAYQRWLVEWLTERWHSKFKISPETWEVFRTKTAAILNESLLTAKLKELGYAPETYGDKKYY